MRVLHLLATDRRRGAEVFARDLARALDRSAPGMQNRVVALRRGEGPGALGVEVARGAGLVDLVRTADVVVGHGSRTVRVARWRRRPPFVYRVIGDPRHWSARWDRRVRTARALGRADRIAVYDIPTARAVEEHLGVGEDRIRVVPKGIDVAAHRPPGPDEIRAARRRWELPEGRPVVVWIGALTDEKDPLTAVGMLAELPGVHLLVVGAGPLRALLDSHAERLGVAGRIRFTGPLDGVGDALDAADVLVSTSRTEGTAGVLLEAGLHGLPVAATAVGGTPGVVDEGRTGTLFDPGDPRAAAGAVRRALAHRATWGPAARERIGERHDMGPVARAWEALLGELARDRSSG